MESRLAWLVGCALLLAGCDVTGTVRPSPVAFSSIAAGANHTCALQAEGKAYCWGDNSSGQLGSGSADPMASVPRAVAGDVSFTQLAGGAVHSCGVSDAGLAWCWGSNSDGQSGPVGGSSPALVSSTLHFRMVSLGRLHSCGVTPAGAAYCWGHDGSGQLGDGGTQAQSSPVAVDGDYVFASVAAGDQYTCGLTTAGAAYCWGYNVGSDVVSILGTGDTKTLMYLTPVPVAGGHLFAALAAGLYHGCGLAPDGAAYCWGLNVSGQVGDGTFDNHAVPVPVAGDHRYTAIVAGEVHSCALTVDGQAWCWGDDSFDQLGAPPASGSCRGTGGATCSTTPVRVPIGTPLASLAAGRFHTCGLDRAGNAYCWGRNERGQGGVGTTDEVLPVPTAVMLPR